MEQILLDLSENYTLFELCIYAAVVGACISLLVGCFIEIHRFINEITSTREEEKHQDAWHQLGDAYLEAMDELRGE